MQHVIRRLVLDVLKLRDPPIHEFALPLSSIPNIEDVRVSIVEIDEDTESVKVKMEGGDVDLDSAEEIMKNYGAVIHSIDKVVVERTIRS